MPQLGDIAQVKEIWPNRQYSYKDGFQRYIWIACPECGKQRWVDFYNARKTYGRCQLCATRHNCGAGNGAWKGGRYEDPQGYIHIKLATDDFFYAMASQIGYVKEHRLVMAKHLQRLLQSWEIVHHKNGIKTDNRIANLQLVIRGQHSRAHGKGYQDGYQQGYKDGQATQIKDLKQEIRLLRLELKQYQQHTPIKVFQEAYAG